MHAFEPHAFTADKSGLETIGIFYHNFDLPYDYNSWWTA